MAEHFQVMQERVLASTGDAPERYLIQEMVDDGVELMLGFHREPVGDAILLDMDSMSKPAQLAK